MEWPHICILTGGWYHCTKRQTNNQLSDGQENHSTFCPSRKTCLSLYYGTTDLPYSPWNSIPLQWVERTTWPHGTTERPISHIILADGPDVWHHANHWPYPMPLLGERASSTGGVGLKSGRLMLSCQTRMGRPTPRNTLDPLTMYTETYCFCLYWLQKGEMSTDSYMESTATAGGQEREQRVKCPTPNCLLHSLELCMATDVTKGLCSRDSSLPDARGLWGSFKGQ